MTTDTVTGDWRSTPHNTAMWKLENAKVAQRPRKVALRAVYGECWAIMPGKLEAIVQWLEHRAEHGKFAAEEVAERMGAARGRPKAITGDVAVLPLHGVISQRAGSIWEMLGMGTSTESFAALFNAAVGDERVGAIVLDVDSPGGSVGGVAELSKTIHAARGKKPIIAVANSLAASAAYWLASSADSLSVTPSGEVGSIGVVAAHEDISAAEEQVGVKTTLISAGKHKTLGSPHEPLNEEAHAAIQKRVDEYYDMFVRDVARNRNVSVSAVRNGFAEGDVVGAVEAKALNMADNVETLDDVVGRLMGRQSGKRSTAHAERRLRLAKARQ